MYKITTEYKSKKVELFKSSKEKATELFKHVCELNSIDYHEDTTPEEWEKERPYLHTGNLDVSITLEYIQTISGKDIETILEALEIAREEMRNLINANAPEAIKEAARNEYKKFNDLIIKLS